MAELHFESKEVEEYYRKERRVLGIGHPCRSILTPESCPQRFKLLLFCRVIKAHIWFLRILKFGWLQISETWGGPRQRGCAQGAKKPTATPLWA